MELKLGEIWQGGIKRLNLKGRHFGFLIKALDFLLLMSKVEKAENVEISAY